MWGVRGLGLILFACFVFPAPQAAAIPSLIYDLEAQFENPLAPEQRENFNGEDISRCYPCADFYRVNRLVGPLIYHVFVGARVHVYCDGRNGPSEQLQIYGAVKAVSDGAAFRRFIAAPHTHANRLQYLGTGCGENAELALARAVEISRGKQAEVRAHSAWATLRFLSTPILGRPCAQAAAEISRELSAWIAPIEPEIPPAYIEHEFWRFL